MTKTSAKQGTTDRWKDSLGQEFRPGDMIAVAVINGRSPQMVIAMVERINTTNAKGEPHTKRAWTGKKKPREVVYKTYVGPKIPDPPDFRSGRLYGQRATEPRIRKEWAEYHEEKARLEADPANWRIDEVRTAWDEIYEEVPTVTVTAKPILDGRGFYRSGTRATVWDKEPPAIDPADIKSVTYQFVGNIVRLPDTLDKDEVLAIARRPVEYPPSWGW